MRSTPFATALACQLLACVFATYILAEEAKKEPPNEGSQYPLLAQALALNGKGLPPDPVADKYVKAFNSAVDLEYPGTPIREVMLDLKDRFDMSIYLDEPALTSAKISNMAPFAFHKKNTPLFIGLHDMARTQNLTLHYRYHAIWLTTPKAAKD